MFPEEAFEPEYAAAFRRQALRRLVANRAIRGVELGRRLAGIQVLLRPQRGTEDEQKTQHAYQSTNKLGHLISSYFVSLNRHRHLLADIHAGVCTIAVDTKSDSVHKAPL